MRSVRDDSDVEKRRPHKIPSEQGIFGRERYNIRVAYLAG